jgi:type II secretory pathway component PulM
MIKSFWDKLDKKQRYIVAGVAAFVLIALILELVIFPLWDANAKIKQTLQINQKKLDEVIKLDTEFAGQEAKISKIKRVMSTRTADFSLFSYLEKKAAQAGVRGNIKYMNSSRGTQSANFEESLIDMKLDKITIKQLTDFLYFAESPADLVRIKRITVTKMKESPEYLSAQLQIASMQALSSRPGGL